MTKIYRDYIPYYYSPYLDNIAVKGPKTYYNNKEVELGIRRFIAKHLLNIN